MKETASAPDRPLRVAIGQLPDEFGLRDWKSDFEQTTGFLIERMQISTEDAARALAAGDCDLVVMGRTPLRREFPRGAFERRQLYTDDFAFVLHREETEPELRALLAAGEPLTRAEVAELLTAAPGLELLTHETASASYRLVVEEILHDDVRGGRVGGGGARLVPIASHWAIVGLLRRGPGRVTLLPSSVANTTLQPDDTLARIEITDSPRRSTFVVRPADPGGPAHGPAGEALWEFLRRRVAAGPSTHHLISILFTDLEQSTVLTQRLGDDRAQQILHAHNAAVRLALADYGGHEVKHTGDGIMATFPSAVRAVQAALQIRRDLRVADAHVRVGISAGEPIEEDDDIFGAAVQLGARVCALADPGEVLVAGVVRDLLTGKEFRFLDRGETTVRGFLEPIRLFAVEAKAS